MEGPEWQRLACWAGQKVEAGEGIEAKDLGGKVAQHWQERVPSFTLDMVLSD